jgi:hypothetical protein
MRKLRELIVTAAMAWLAVYLLLSGEPAHLPTLLRAEPQRQETPRPSHMPPVCVPARPAASEVAVQDDEPEQVWLRAESSSGEALAEVSVSLRRVGDEFRAPLDLNASTTTDVTGLVALAIEPFESLALEDEAELLVQVSGYTSKLVSEAELMTSLGSEEPYIVVLEPSQSLTLAARCPVESEATVYVGWYTDDGVDVQRFEGVCNEDGWFEVEDIEVPRTPLHFVAFLADPEAPWLGLRTYQPAGSASPQRIEISLSSYPVEFRSVQVVDQRGTGIAGTYVVPVMLTSPGALLDRWLNDDAESDEEGNFGWISLRGRTSSLSVMPPGRGEATEVELRPAQATIRLDSMSVVRCHFLAASGEVAPFRDFGLQVEQSAGEAFGWHMSGAGPDSSGQHSFTWPENARQLRINSVGFQSITLSSPLQPCILRAQ